MAFFFCIYWVSNNTLGPIFCIYRALCDYGSLDPKKVKGKIVVCMRGVVGRVTKGINVRDAGGVGIVIANEKQDGDNLIADPHFLPATMITYEESLKLFSYMNSTK
jgi:PA domain